ncbi:MAG TPA: ATP-binding protein [Gammaproteobacteria bacterium]|nr:ATP-binding protein [Gammaproteobacteria bacterium]
MHSIGTRLTVRYAASFACALLLLGGGVLFTVRENLYHAVDESLRERAEGVRRFIDEHEARLSLPAVKEEFRAHGDYFEVADQDGRRVYQAETMQGVSAPGGAEVDEAGRFDQVTTRQGTPLRLFSRNVDVGGRHYTIQVAAPLADVQQGLRDALKVLLPMFPVVLLLACAGGYWMSRRALAPVDELTQAARSITADRLSKRLFVPKTGDELERLAQTLNDMIERLERAFRQISQFTSDASHELRTPLAVMRTTAEVALRSPTDSVECREALEHIVVELDRTSHLVENLLLIAKADAGDAALSRKPVNLADAVNEACTEVGVLGQVKGIGIEARLPAEPVWVSGDAHSLRRLFVILLDNAIKYTPVGGSCEASVALDRGFAVGTVRDTGIGIADEERAHIFERFYRVDRARTRHQGGAGLGLAIGRWIVEAHGGRISLESELNLGSVFRVELPLAASRLPGASALHATEEAEVTAV